MGCRIVRKTKATGVQPQKLIKSSKSKDDQGMARCQIFHMKLKSHISEFSGSRRQASAAEAKVKWAGAIANGGQRQPYFYVECERAKGGQRKVEGWHRRARKCGAAYSSSSAGPVGKQRLLRGRPELAVHIDAWLGIQYSVVFLEHCNCPGLH
jgi:hypothetical protein